MKNELTARFWSLSRPAPPLSSDELENVGSPCVAWQKPAADVALPCDEVHVWRIWLDQTVIPLPEFERLLSGDERARAARFHFPRDHRRFVTGRGFLRKLLGNYLHLDPRQIFFFYGRNGKPRLTPVPDSAVLHFNVSHSDDLALIAVTRDCEIGIDVEHIRPITEADQIAARFFTPRELAQWRALPPELRTEAFFNCWTRKEACLKANGGTLDEALKQIDVSLSRGNSVRLFSVPDNSWHTSYWSIMAFTPAPEFAGALAVKGRPVIFPAAATSHHFLAA
ncbi:MAG: 4'-phosphopantetheinyl transferase superfamily protein [Verrucomicrobiota bacterium]